MKKYAMLYSLFFKNNPKYVMKISLIGSVITHLFIKSLNVLSQWIISVVFVEASVRHKVFTFYLSHPFAPQVKETHYRIMFRIC